MDYWWSKQVALYQAVAVGNTAKEYLGLTSRLVNGEHCYRLFQIAALSPQRSPGKDPGRSPGPGGGCRPGPRLAGRGVVRRKQCTLSSLCCGSELRVCRD